MLLYNRYISNKIFVAFAAFTTILVALIWFSRAVGFVSYVTENGIELSKFLYLFVLILPWMLLFIIPIALFAGILIAYNRLNVTNEITILKNSGLTKLAICKPAIKPTLTASLLCFLISFFLMPYANKEMRISRNSFQNDYANLSFSPKTFETLKNLTIYAKNRDEQNQLYGILLHDEKSDKSSLTITAESGNIKNNGTASLLYMKNGTIQKYNYDSRKSEILHFDSYVFNLTEGKQEIYDTSWKAKERYFSELLSPEEGLTELDLSKFRSEINKRITNPLQPIIFAMIALSWILHGKFSRHGNIKNLVAAIMTATFFMATIIVIYSLIESSAKYVPLLYLNFTLFFVIAFKMLKQAQIKNK